MTREELVNKIVDMQYNNKDTFTMLKAADKVPDDVLSRIVGVSPQGVYTSVGHVEYGTAPSAEIVTTTTGTSITNTDSYINITTEGTAASFVTYDTVTIDGTSVTGDMWDASTGDTWEPPPAPKRKRKKKAVPIQISPRNPGMRRILLED